MSQYSKYNAILGKKALRHTAFSAIMLGSIVCIYSFFGISDDALSQVSSVTSSVSNAGVYEIPARLRTLHNLVIRVVVMEPVILNESFERSEVKRLLTKFYKVRGK